MSKETRRNLSITPNQAISLYFQLGLFLMNVFDKQNTLYIDAVRMRERLVKLYPEIKEHVEKR